MNEVLQTIRDRYSCRDFKSGALTAEQINQLVEAGLAAPSAMNLQPWHISVVTDKAFIEEMDAAAMAEENKNEPWYERIMGRGGKLFYNAPVMFFIAKNDSHWATHDVGIVCQNITLAAHSMGLASIIVAMARIPLSGSKGEDFIKRLKFPEGMEFCMSVCVGYANSGKAPHELDRSKVTYI